MSYLKEFVVGFSGLSEGKHEFEYLIDDRFFHEFEYSEITEGKVKMLLILEKKPTMLILDFKMEGAVNCLCDRCAEVYSQAVSGNERLIVKFSDEPEQEEENENIKVLSSKAHEIDISQDLYEFITLLIPVKRTHPTDENGNETCNPETLHILNSMSKKDTIDPRWEDLNKISFKN